MSSGLINSRTLIPPIPVGRGMSDEEWMRKFPGAVRRSWESEEEYRARTTQPPQQDSPIEHHPV